MATQIRSDAFSRLTLYRETVRAPSYGCAWCGNRNRAGNLYRYTWRADTLRAVSPGTPRFAFCSISCARTSGEA